MTSVNFHCKCIQSCDIQFQRRRDAIVFFKNNILVPERSMHCRPATDEQTTGVWDSSHSVGHAPDLNVLRCCGVEIDFSCLREEGRTRSETFLIFHNDHY